MPIHKKFRDQRLASFWICLDCDKVLRAKEIPEHHKKKHSVQHYNYDPRPVTKK